MAFPLYLESGKKVARLEAEGLRVEPVAMTELAKAEAGVTCCSLLLRQP